MTGRKQRDGKREPPLQMRLGQELHREVAAMVDGRYVLSVPHAVRILLLEALAHRKGKV